ncbi:PDZ domain-containing protein [Heyndrickxia ginsengihumi]|uniref:PDZ domain-containing protein n=1 Tax=Heyndrickxia ginsengihumi TaxID=363870 RepID=UPI002041E97D|nr:PDZ domain-containing protein [Heyndrickxia ginsengihumi]MCM3023366.1 PDZ domain-containing protein [Heyndrickxia ginsengihumi]
MGQIWIEELLKGVVRFFLQPIVYYAILIAIFTGYLRVKRERKDFHVRLFSIFQELKFLFPLGLLAGLILSIVSVVTGYTIAYPFIVAVTIVTILFSLIGQFRYLSPAFTMGTALILLFLLRIVPISSLSNIVQAVSYHMYTGFAILLGLFMIVEGWLMRQNGAKQLSPKLRKSRRGFTVGVFQAKRIWLVPVLCLLPLGPLTSSVDWWPVISWGGHSFSFVLVPFLLGFQQQIQSTLPQQAIDRVSKQVCLVGILTIIIAAAGYWYPIFSIVAAFVAILLRGFISLGHRMRENAAPYYFTPQIKGLMVLAVIPGSPADKMGLEKGEIIQKCNGKMVRHKDEFYQALQINPAFCKLEVLDIHNEIRFAQGALFVGDHHELGLLTLDEKPDWDSEKHYS